MYKWTKSSDGMEKNLSQQLNYLVKTFDYDITIVTTENNSFIFSNKKDVNKILKAFDRFLFPFLYEELG